jgi:hypothetical protein
MYPWAFELFGPETGDLLIRLASLPAWVTVVLWASRRLWLGTNALIAGEV